MSFMADPWLAPNRFDVVERVNDAHPGLIHDSHAFTEAVACELRAEDAQWGRNGKRGNPNDLSDDAIAWQNAAVPWGCSIVDIIGGAGGPDPSPAWIDQTHATADDGTVGVLVAPECAGVPEPGPEPPVTTPPPVTPPVQPTPPPPVITRAEWDALMAEVALIRDQVDYTSQGLFNHTPERPSVLAHIDDVKRMIAGLPRDPCFTGE